MNKPPWIEQAPHIQGSYESIVYILSHRAELTGPFTGVVHRQPSRSRGCTTAADPGDLPEIPGVLFSDFQKTSSRLGAPWFYPLDNFFGD